MNQPLLAYSEASAASTLASKEQDGDASGATTTTNTLTQFTINTSQKSLGTMEISKMLTLKTSQTTLYSAAGSHANLIALLESVKGSKMFAEKFFMRLSELQGLKDLSCYSWKMLKDSLAAKKDKPLEPYWKNWGISDIGASGRLLTANTSAFHRIGSACSLWDILEKDVPDKYFLSDKAIAFLKRNQNRKTFALQLLAATTNAEKLTPTSCNLVSPLIAQTNGNMAGDSKKMERKCSL